ncbi:aldehyde dehydrogenase family protein [Lentibacillus sp. CBA3610]|uniref:aldehyde dehydrogenase family protein n=1 Tax=Lentibacillus sp. CBA3610 TaxID=2518176 RepID=UPI001595EA97|nr:aldehyde dehydrogenase family protein [Lentibacillus sp. CBA3610]QKY71544.1 aldehyde dehydrogenase family protein [Lentibacillus sp. CBA3610]
MLELKMFINGEWVDSESNDIIKSVNPANMREIANFPRGNEQDINKAVKSAKEAFESVEWKEMVYAERGRKLLHMADLIRENKEHLAELETEDMGKPLTQARTDVEVAARYFEYFGGAADKILGETIPINPEMLDYTVREPFGVTAHIVPWNYPIQMTARSLAPALAAGNTAVVKPAEDTSVTSLHLAKLSEKAGFPKGVINIITGYGGEAGSALSSHTDIDHITFTGSVPTGSSVMKNAAENIKSLTLELGGKSPNIVFEDAEFEETAQWVVKTLIQNGGQTCTAGTRLIIEEGIKNKFLDRVSEIMKNITVGPGLDDYDMGPIVSEKQIKNLEKYMDIAKEEGTKILQGGNRKKNMPSNLFFEPTIVVPDSEKSRLAQEELFGPIVTVLTFESKEEALALANSTEYGLVTGIWTKNIDKALWLSSRVKSGQVFINNYGAGGGVEMPFGGQGKSGFGREKGLESLKHYTQVKNVAIKIKN